MTTCKHVTSTLFKTGLQPVNNIYNANFCISTGIIIHKLVCYTCTLHANMYTHIYSIYTHMNTFPTHPHVHIHFRFGADNTRTLYFSHLLIALGVLWCIVSSVHSVLRQTACCHIVLYIRKTELTCSPLLCSQQPVLLGCPFIR